jgi:Nucleotidyl transferase AbiEii toxin, Type IV TA system
LEIAFAIGDDGMTDLHWETVTPLMRDVMRTVGASDLCPRFYLAGGTALALQLGHRRSVDLDFFSETDEVRPETHHNRDFEAQVVRDLVYFERADQEAPLPLLCAVEWSTIKTFFREQAIRLGQAWLEDQNGLPSAQPLRAIR